MSACLDATMQRLRAARALRQLPSLAYEGVPSQLQAQRFLAAQPAAAPQDDTIEVTVDGKPVRVAKGSNVLQACDAAGVDVPRSARVQPARNRAPSWAQGEARRRLRGACR